MSTYFPRHFIEMGVSRANLTQDVSGSRLPTPDPSTTPIYPLNPPLFLPTASAVRHLGDGQSLSGPLPAGDQPAVWSPRCSPRQGQQVFSVLMLLLACLSVSIHLLSHTCTALEKRAISVFLFFLN